MKFKKIFPSWSRKKTIVVSVFLAAILALSLLIGILNITITANVSGREYSLDNVMSHLYSISKEEHSVYQQESLTDVRSYISSALYSYGVKNETVTHRTRYIFNEKTADVEPYAPKNLYAEIKGASGASMLLVAHYDSCPYKIKYGEASEGSHGAIDDGYGVAVLLELARIYSGEKLTNGIKFAFTDCEEEGCLGSEALVEEYGDWLADVNIVINVESRGETGPVYLFQTSENNSELIKFYKNAGFPYTFSVAAEIYNMMPNDTDLSPFLDGGYAGLNVASLDGIKNYHNGGDVFENVDENTLAKYCDTLLPLLNEYTQNSKYSDMDCFKSSSSSLFFTLFPNALVSYNAITGWVFFGIALALVIMLIAILARKKKIRIKKTLLSLGIDIGLLALVCGLGFLIAAIASAICGVKFHFMFVIAVGPDVWLLAIFSILAVVATALSTLLKSKLCNSSEMTAGALVFHAVLSVASAAALFGGSFIFVIPTFLVAIAAFFTLLENRKLKALLVGGITAIAAIFTLSFYVSLIYSVYVSLSFGALGLLIALPVIPLGLLLPQAFDFYKEEKAL